MGKTLTERVEEKTFEIIEDLADELGLDVPFYPEVYWLGKNLEFDELGLQEEDEDSFESFKDNKGSFYMVRENIIFIGDNNLGHIAEEAGHFLHFANSGIDYKNIRDEESVLISSIVEMFGYFCSKLMDNDRENAYRGYPDIFGNKKACIEELAADHVYNKDSDSKIRTYSLEMEKDVKNRIDMLEFIIYQQGYGMGEKLFDAYISGLIPATKIKELMLKDFKEEGEATLEFFNLKHNLLSYPKAEF